MAASKSSGLASLGKLTELKQRLLFVIGALIVFRLGSFIPVPGVNPEAMARLISNSGGLIDMFNMFSGGALLQLSVFAIGIMPYITASIIVQLLTVVIPRFEELRKEGQAGQAKMTQYTRYLTVALALLQATGIVALAANGNLLQGQANCDAQNIIRDQSILGLAIIVIVFANLVMTLVFWGTSAGIRISG